ncbi:MAG: hypothetical protein R3C14_32585 [Caldilineaceae bacterium]
MLHRVIHKRFSILGVLTLLSVLSLGRSTVVIAQGGRCLDPGNVVCIDTSGRVGIGTQSPAEKLEFRLQSRSTEQVYIARAYYNPKAILRLMESSPIIQMDDTTNGAYIRGYNNGDRPNEVSDAGALQFGRIENVNAITPTFIPRMHISGNGNVGIGRGIKITNPQALLDVQGTQDGQWGMSLWSDGGEAQGFKIATGWAGHGSDSNDSPVIIFQANAATSGDDGKNGEVPIFTVQTPGRVGVNTTTPKAALDVVGTTRTQILEISGGADIAEPFAVADSGTIEPGMVVAIDPANPGQLHLADKAYDHMVAGVISGAGGIQPGLILQQEGSIVAGGHPVALTGRVYVWADASNGAIQPGDMLTTSDTPGHAMKVTDHDQAQGAILGKAMTDLGEGTGLVLVLVTLQ